MPSDFLSAKSQSRILDKIPLREEFDLLNEVMALRKEIADLRAELRPVPSLILTGREALDEFKRLTGNVSNS